MNVPAESAIIAARLDDVRQRLARACAAAERDPATVRLVAVSKMHPAVSVEAAYAQGQRDFGENYVQELEEKRGALPDDIAWHFIGHLQSNKAKAVVATGAVVHTVDSLKLGQALARASEGLGRRTRVLIQVNSAGEPTKAGVSPEGALELAHGLGELSALELVGLMCIPPQEEPARWFAELRALRDRLQQALARPLPELSMGMSDDFEAAIHAGSTLVRVGTQIFGRRT